ncbi:MAG TPA: PIN domain-containing protein [Chloroflexota bacterium]|nr:PIN domain-containing protein [Chloroflexota bacterium]
MAVEVGWLDTNIFVHALSTTDAHYARCNEIINALIDGRAVGRLSPLVLHELSYVLSRRPRFTRATIQTYLATIVNTAGIHAPDKPMLVAAVDRWGNGTMGFVDAYLTELAGRDGIPICSVSARDFPATPNSYATATL